MTDPASRRKTAVPLVIAPVALVLAVHSPAMAHGFGPEFYPVFLFGWAVYCGIICLPTYAILQYFSRRPLLLQCVVTLAVSWLIALIAAMRLPLEDIIVFSAVSIGSQLLSCIALFHLLPSTRWYKQAAAWMFLNSLIAGVLYFPVSTATTDWAIGHYHRLFLATADSDEKFRLAGLRYALMRQQEVPSADPYSEEYYYLRTRYEQSIVQGNSEYIDELSLSGGIRAYPHAATDTHVLAFFIQQLQTHPNPEIRAELALELNCGSDTMYRIMQDYRRNESDPKVRKNLLAALNRWETNWQLPLTGDEPDSR